MGISVLDLEGGERTPRPVAKRIAPIPTVTRAPTSRRPVSEGVVAALGDERGFVHKRIFRGIKGFIGGGPIGAIGGFLAPGRPEVVPGATGCPQGFVNILGQCRPSAALSQPIFSPTIPGVPSGLFPDGGRDGARDQITLGGDAELGRFGAGVNPAFFSSQTRRCPRGMVLGAPEADGESLCYNKRDLSNKERMWPRGRRPLLTGGDMRCISVASSAAKKLQRKQKQLEELGMLRKPARRGGRSSSPVHVRTAGVAHN